MIGSKLGEDTLAFRELTAAADDRVLLRRFDDEIYTPAFPDPDEKEALENIERYLELKAAGWYEANGYHVLLLLSEDQLVGGAIADYLAEPNAGVVEFLAVAPAWRGRGLGRRLLDKTEALIRLDAQRAGRRGPDRIVAEIEDPFRVDPSPDRFDPFARARIWGAWGFRKLDFPYVQPALSESQQPVLHLMLATKPLAHDERETIPSARILDTLRAYLRWAMRIPDAEANAEYRGMRDRLARLTRVSSTPLERYVGHDPAASVGTAEITGEGPDLEAVVAVYARAFPPAPTALDAAAFRLAVLTRFSAPAADPYHLWAIRAAGGGDGAGMASFFSLPGIGFGGYVAFDDALRGRRLLRSLVAQMEARMHRDGTGAKGWLIECAPDSDALEAFSRVGFSEIALDYRQPPLGRAATGETAARLCLAYKDFGASDGPPTLTRYQLRAALRSVYRVVYGIEAPEQHPCFVVAEAQMQAWPTDEVEWRAARRAC